MLNQYISIKTKTTRDVSIKEICVIDISIVYIEQHVALKQFTDVNSLLYVVIVNRVNPIWQVIYTVIAKKNYCT